jgi:hypothetical protein
MRLYAKTTPLIVFVLTALLILPRDVYAEDHVVSPADLQEQMEAASDARQKNLAKMDHFFSVPRVKKALESSGLAYSAIQKAIPQLSDDELARLASRAEKAQRDFEAGALTNQEITYIIIALATAVIILVIVEAK